MVELAPFAGLDVRLGIVAGAPIRVAPTAGALAAEIARTETALRRRWAGQPPAAIPGLTPARRLYRAFSIDPTRTRPSSEALLRRIVRGGALPRISNAVDLGNLLAVTFLLPIGLYDAAAVHGPVTLRRGEPGEAYRGVRKDQVHLAGRPVLADSDGPFGNPTADSARTAVGDATRALWMVIFAPGSFAADRLAEHVAVARAAFGEHLAGDTPLATDGAVRSAA